MPKALRVSSTHQQSSPWRRWCSATLLAALLAPETALGAPSPPPAESNSNPDLARSIAVTGREAFNAGDYETALALFRRAYALYPAPTLVLYEARSLEKQGRLLEADEAYLRTAQMPVGQDAPAQFAEAIAQARQEERALRAQIPTLTVEVLGVSVNDPSLSVTVNGRAIGAAQLGQAQRLNPGTYRIAGSIGGDRSDHSEVKLTASQHAKVVLNLAAPLPAPPAPVATATQSAPQSPEPHGSGSRRLAYVSGGIGVVGLGAGVITGIASVQAHGRAKRDCPDDMCAPNSSGSKDVQSFHSLRTLSSVFYGVGVAGLAAGVVLWLTAGPDSVESAQAQPLAPWADARSVGVQGTF